MRALDFPTEWALVLSAVDAEDYDLAYKLVRKYHFDRDVNSASPRDAVSPFIYKWTSPDGKTGVVHGAPEMGKIMGVPNSTINNMFTRRGHPDVVEWWSGKYKGWILERSSKR